VLLEELLKAVSVKEVVGEKRVTIKNVEVDSKSVRGKGLFIALQGYTVDGHDFIEDAIKNGAVAVVVCKEVKVPTAITKIVVENTREAMVQIACRFYGDPTSQLKLIGITGTNGKTTVSNIVDYVLNDQGYVTGLIGTMEHRIAGEKVTSQNTTPDSLELQKMFREMLKKNATHAVMEVSSHGLELGRVKGCRFSVGGFTNITQDHLDFHPTFEEYRKAKAKLFSGLSKESVAVLNADDEASNSYAGLTAAPTKTFGILNKADITATEINITSSGMSFVVNSRWGKEKVSTHLLGMFNVYNLLHSIGILMSLEISLNDITTSIAKIEGVRGRMETVKTTLPFPIIVDYAHTPDALENVLKTIKEFTKGRIITVVGCGGNRDRSKRPMMARV
jgi:UDP-N-acetylmuramoyl-L-alanyl-D-glutamate--2,6-diaminopimelate ligase